MAQTCSQQQALQSIRQYRIGSTACEQHIPTRASTSAADLHSCSSETHVCSGFTTVFRQSNTTGVGMQARETRRATRNDEPEPVLHEADRHAAQFASSLPTEADFGFRRNPTPTDSMMTAHKHPNSDGNLRHCHVDEYDLEPVTSSHWRQSEPTA
jgi:hypothetical protein